MCTYLLNINYFLLLQSPCQNFQRPPNSVYTLQPTSFDGNWRATLTTCRRILKLFWSIHLAAVTEYLSNFTSVQKTPGVTINTPSTDLRSCLHTETTYRQHWTNRLGEKDKAGSTGGQELGGVHLAGRTSSLSRAWREASHIQVMEMQHSPHRNSKWGEWNA